MSNHDAHCTYCGYVFTCYTQYEEWQCVKCGGVAARNTWGIWYLSEQAKRDAELERRERDYDYEQAIGGRNLGR